MKDTDEMMEYVYKYFKELSEKGKAEFSTYEANDLCSEKSKWWNSGWKTGRALVSRPKFFEMTRRVKTGRGFITFWRVK